MTFVLLDKGRGRSRLDRRGLVEPTSMSFGDEAPLRPHVPGDDDVLGAEPVLVLSNAVLAEAFRRRRARRRDPASR